MKKRSEEDLLFWRELLNKSTPMKQKRDNKTQVWSAKKLNKKAGPNHSFGFEDAPNHSIKTHLNQILQNNVDPKYHFSENAMKGMVSRMERRNKRINEELLISIHCLIDKTPMPHSASGVFCGALRRDVAVTLTTGNRHDMSSENLVVEAETNVIRGLTPIERERLQGFPDGHTDILSGTNRCKTIGNSMAIPVITWIGERIGQENASFGSVCSGIEAASIAWNPLGIKAKWFSEIDPYASQVLQKHWPNIPNLGDMVNIAQQIKEGVVKAPDILIGGTSCQTFSVSGLREGLSDDRGRLTFSFAEIFEETLQQNPNAIAVWENVPGILTMKDKVFQQFIGRLLGADGKICLNGRLPQSGVAKGPAGGVAWRILDAQFFGVPQRRRRVFVVASASAELSADILFERRVESG